MLMFCVGLRTSGTGYTEGSCRRMLFEQGGGMGEIRGVWKGTVSLRGRGVWGAVGFLTFLPHPRGFCRLNLLGRHRERFCLIRIWAPSNVEMYALRPVHWPTHRYNDGGNEQGPALCEVLYFLQKWGVAITNKQKNKQTNKQFPLK